MYEYCWIRKSVGLYWKNVFGSNALLAEEFAFLFFSDPWLM
jgi:hypothetical protein